MSAEDVIERGKGDRGEEGESAIVDVTTVSHFTCSNAFVAEGYYAIKVKGRYCN